MKEPGICCIWDRQRVISRCTSLRMANARYAKATCTHTPHCDDAARKEQHTLSVLVYSLVSCQSIAYTQSIPGRAACASSCSFVVVIFAV